MFPFKNPFKIFLHFIMKYTLPIIEINFNEEGMKISKYKYNLESKFFWRILVPNIFFSESSEIQVVAPFNSLIINEFGWKYNFLTFFMIKSFIQAKDEHISPWALQLEPWSQSKAFWNLQPFGYIFWLSLWSWITSQLQLLVISS